MDVTPAGLSRCGRPEVHGGPDPASGQAVRDDEETDRRAIAALYGLLAARVPSPAVELNRAVVVSMADGPEPAPRIADTLAAEPAPRDYHVLPSVRGDLLRRLGRTAQARAEFERTASLTGNERERELMLRRAAQAG